MTRFEDQLWADLVADHGDDLAHERVPSLSRRRRPLVLTAGGIGLAGAATAVALTLTATTGAVSAYAVTANPNGTVTITIKDLVGIKGANEQLAKLGVPIRAVPITANCKTSAVPPPAGRSAGQSGKKVTGGPEVPAGNGHAGTPAEGQRVTTTITGGPDGLVIDPKQIPKGATMVLAASKTDGKVALAGAMVNGPAPTCLSVPGVAGRPTEGPEQGTSNGSRDSGGHMTSGSAPPTR